MHGATWGGGRAPDALPRSVYWKRRALAAAALLLLVAFLAWACGGPGEAPPGASGRQVAAPSDVDPVPSPSPLALAAPGASRQPSARPSEGAAATSPAGTTARAPAAASAGEGAERGDRSGSCRAGDLRLRLTADAESYPPGERPTFEVLVTSGRPCVVDLGRRSLRVVVTSGSDRIWSSADCARDEDRMRRVSPHLPREETFAWQRVRSGPGRCREREAAARSGWYVAVAELGGAGGGATGGVTSQKVVFRLR